MSAALTRRALVASVAAIGTGAAVVAVPVLASPAPDPDVALLDLIARHAEAEDEVQQLSVMSDRTWLASLDAYPSRPEALRWRPDDFPRTGFGLGLASRDEEGAPTHYGEGAARWLRECEPFDARARRHGAAMSPAEAEACEVRRLEVVAEWDAHVADRRAVEDRVGHTAASAAEDAAADLVHSLEMEIKRARPVTLAELRALARWMGKRERAGAAHDDFLALLAATVAGFGEVMS